MRDDPESIRAWVADVCRVAQLSGLADEMGDRVIARLEKGAREYGPESYRERGLDGVLAEAAEEGVDIPGWLTRAVVLLYEELDRGMDSGRMQDLHGRLIRAAAHGVLARAWIESVRAELDGVR